MNPYVDKRGSPTLNSGRAREREVEEKSDNTHTQGKPTKKRAAPAPEATPGDSSEVEEAEVARHTAQQREATNHTHAQPPARKRAKQTPAPRAGSTSNADESVVARHAP